MIDAWYLYSSFRSSPSCSVASFRWDEERVAEHCENEATAGNDARNSIEN